jgi:hypothetical protein
MANSLPQREKVSLNALEWSKTHIRRFGDSDILPPPFEYEAIEVRWLPVREYLLNVDLATYEIRALQHFLVPKPEGGWRIATRLDPYNLTVDDIPDDDKARLTRETLRELFDECVSGRPLRLGLARHVFRSAATIRTRILHAKTMKNLEILAPVLRDAFNYLMRTRSQSKGHEVAQELSRFARNSSFSFSPFVWEWVSHALLRKYAQDGPAEIKKLSREARPLLGLRP